MYYTFIIHNQLDRMLLPSTLIYIFTTIIDDILFTREEKSDHFDLIW